MSQATSVSNHARARVARPPCADAAIARWLQRTLVTDPPRAKSLIVTVWGDALRPHGGAVWLAGLIRLMAPFGINERLVRTSVFRLARDGWLAARSHGRRSRYQLTRGGARRFDDAYRRIYARPADAWGGQWELVLADGVAPADRRGLRDELKWAGFGQSGPASFLRPLQAGQAHPAILASPGIADRVLLMRAGDAPDARPIASLASGAWDLPKLAVDYRHFLQRFGAVIDRFRAGDNHDPAQCFAVRILLIHAYRRVLLRDPLLPPALLPLDWPGSAAYALCRDFYRLTHRCAERHLAATLTAAGETFPPANAAFHARFGGLSEA